MATTCLNCKQMLGDESSSETHLPYIVTCGGQENLEKMDKMKQ